jgi:streptogramin lyase
MAPQFEAAMRRAMWRERLGSVTIGSVAGGRSLSTRAKGHIVDGRGFMPVRTKHKRPNRPVRYLVLPKKPTMLVAMVAAITAVGTLTWLGVAAPAGEPKASVHPAAVSQLLAPPAVPAGAYLGVDPGFSAAVDGPDNGVENGVHSDVVSQQSGVVGNLPPFESQMGRIASVVSFYIGYTQSPPMPGMNEVADEGSIPLVNWHCGAADSAIADGEDDGIIRADAESYKAFGKPLLLRWFWEMNLPPNPAHAACLGTDTPTGITDGPDGDIWFTNQGNNTIGQMTMAGVTNNFTGPGIDEPTGIVADPSDGSLWFTNQGNNSIGEITTAGVVTNYTGPGIDGPTGIALGPDGNLWFTNQVNNSIGQITPAGVVTNFKGAGNDIYDPTGITAAPDGAPALWFTNQGTPRNNNYESIGEITTGGVITSYTGSGIDDPTGIAAGPDGNLWFTNEGNSSIGQITPAGVITDPAYTGSLIDDPTGITAGPDGNLWFTNEGNSSIGQITTAGAVSNFATNATNGINAPTGIVAAPGGAPFVFFTNPGSNTLGEVTTSPVGVASNYTGTGMDAPSGIVATGGALWFTNTANNSIGQITPAGVVTNYTGPGIDEPTGITLGPDGNLWFTNAGNNSIGRITITGTITITHYTGTGIDDPVGIATNDTGPYMWFTNKGNNSIGLITDAGIVSNYPIPGTSGISTPDAITAGPGGYVWFTNVGTGTNRGSIGSIDPTISTTGNWVMTKPPVFANYPHTATNDIDQPGGIVSADMSLWFTNEANNTIGEITTGTSPTISHYTGTGVDEPTAITANPTDGDAWFTNAGNNSIGVITTGTSPTITNNYTGTGIDDPTAVTLGPDGNLWFTNYGNNSIGMTTDVVVDNDPAVAATEYAAAFQRIWTIFQDVGATNVGFVFSPSAGLGTPSALPYYPGSKYVNWIGLDVYDRAVSLGCPGPTALPFLIPASACRDFQTIFAVPYNTYRPLGKPMMITETGASYSCSVIKSRACEVSAIDQQQWLQEIEDYLPTMFPETHGVVYVNAQDPLGEYELNNPSSGLSQYVGMARTNYFSELG